MDAVFETAIPMPEDDALANEPIRFRAGGIEFVVPLFTLPAFRIFDRLARAMRFRIYVGDDEPIETSLERIIDLSKSNDEVDIEQTIRAAVVSWNAAYPDESCPDDLAALIAAFAWPRDAANAAVILANWYAKQGKSPEIDSSEFSRFRDHIARFLRYALPAAKVSEIVRDLIDVNSEVKKKLLIPTLREIPEPKKKPLLELFSVSSKMREKRQKATSR